MPNSGTFSVKNIGPETVTHVTVTISNQTFTFKAVQPTAIIIQSYNVTGDSGFVVSAQTHSGKTITAADGYVTNGMDFKHDIIIDADAIKIVDVTGQ